MEIKIWRSWASNNSGSYTMVGEFESAELASAVAQKIQAVADAHHEWRDSEGLDESPLSLFQMENGLAEIKETDWPEYNGATVQVVNAKKQIFIHCSYTVTLPPTFGEYIYKKGGRVSLEMEHSHNPVVCEIMAVMYDPHIDTRMVEFKNELISKSNPIFPLIKNIMIKYTKNHMVNLYIEFEDLLQGLKEAPQFFDKHFNYYHLNLREAQTEENPLAMYSNIAETVKV
ncbi:MAG: hypothetical protein EOP04_07860 [Proteobacteria bacterium]|nr:MAG: hypothetical protein EOP04_07860 [Pseudomonadota bacterium]